MHIFNQLIDGAERFTTKTHDFWEKWRMVVIILALAVLEFSTGGGVSAYFKDVWRAGDLIVKVCLLLLVFCGTLAAYAEVVLWRRRVMGGETYPRVEDKPTPFQESAESRE